MEPKIIELPFESEDWISFKSTEKIKNVSKVRIIDEYDNVKKDESRRTIKFNINNTYSFSMCFCSFYTMLKKSKYGKVIISEKTYEITFSSKLFGFDFFKSFEIKGKKQAVLRYKTIEYNSTGYRDCCLGYWKPRFKSCGLFTADQSLVISGKNIGIFFFVENKETDSLDKHEIKILVNDKEKYSSCVNFYSNKISAHFLQLNTLTLDQIVNIYTNRKPVKNKLAHQLYRIDFLDNVIYDLLIIQKIDLAT